MGGETRLNPAVQNIRSGGETVINPALGIAAELPAGTLLPGGYEVVGRLDVPAGEADIFLCRKDGQDYAAKLYRRQIAVKARSWRRWRELTAPTSRRCTIPGAIPAGTSRCCRTTAADLCGAGDLG